MKTLKKVLLVLLGIFVLFVLIGFFLPRHVVVERSLSMKAHPGLIYNQVVILKNWESWSPWQKMDTAAKRTYTGPTIGKGAAFSWESKVLGNGSLTIVDVAPYDSIGISIKMGDRSPSRSSFVLSPDSEGTRVSWTLQMDMGNNPIGRYFGLFMDGIMGKQFDDGLADIRKIVEANGNALLKVDTGRVSEKPYLYIRDKMSMAEIGTKMGEYYPELMGFIQTKGGEMSGPPFSITYSWDNDVFDMADCIPVATAMAGEGRILSAVLPAGKVAICKYYGAYEGTELPYKVMEKFMKDNALESAGLPWEEYITDPSTESNPEKWLTIVYWPLR
jgi:effector-binding domain-containing protein